MEGTEPYKISVAFGRNYPIYPDGFEYLGYEMISPAPENCAPYIVSVTGDKDVYFYFSPW